MIIATGAVGHRPSTSSPTAMSAKLMSSKGRRPMELSQNMAGMDPTRKNRLTALSPKMASWPSPSPKAVMISGPKV